MAITNSGMSALMLTAQALIGHADRVVAVTPLWPNLVEIPKILGAAVDTVALRFTPQGWTLDLDHLLRALTPDTRAVLINSPNNPTGWTIDRDSQRVILEHCRRCGIWIIADDAYERLYYNGAANGVPAVAPSFLAIAENEDRVISTNTFSKSWLMTGFRLGWIVAPKGLAADLPKLIEYNTSCAPPFVQRAGIAAIQGGEPVVQHTTARLRKARDYLIEQLNATPGVQAAAPAGAMYAFFRVRDVDDSLALCKRLVSPRSDSRRASARRRGFRAVLRRQRRRLAEHPPLAWSFGRARSIADSTPNGHGSHACASPTRVEIASWILTGIALLLVLSASAPALLAVCWSSNGAHLVPRLRIWRIARVGKVIAVTVLTIGGLVGDADHSQVIALLRTDVGSISALLVRWRRSSMARAARCRVVGGEPSGQRRRAEANRCNPAALRLRGCGYDFGRAFGHILIGMIIGAFVSLKSTPKNELGPSPRFRWSAPPAGNVPPYRFAQASRREHDAQPSI